MSPEIIDLLGELVEQFERIASAQEERNELVRKRILLEHGEESEELQTL